MKRCPFFPSVCPHLFNRRPPLFPLYANAASITSVATAAVIPSPRLTSWAAAELFVWESGPGNCIPSTMLAINTQLSGLIMWNCGKFTWGSGTNDIRVWPCFSEMAPAPAAGTRRLPKKIWSHFVLPHLLLSPTPPPSPSFPIALSPFPFPSHLALRFVNLTGVLLYFPPSHLHGRAEEGHPTDATSAFSPPVRSLRFQPRYL